MAQKVTVALVDDIDGGPAEETVEFGIDGMSYELDLSNSNAQRLRDALAGYTQVGRKVGKNTRASRSRLGPHKSGMSAAELRKVREWARANGYDVADRGAMKKEVLDAYRHREHA